MDHRRGRVKAWWASVTDALEPLHDAGISVLPIAGNHDTHLSWQCEGYEQAFADLVRWDRLGLHAPSWADQALVGLETAPAIGKRNALQAAATMARAGLRRTGSPGRVMRLPGCVSAVRFTSHPSHVSHRRTIWRASTARGRVGSLVAA